MALAARLVLAGVVAVSCAGRGRVLDPDEIDVRDIRLPEGAAPGMFITWQQENSRGAPDDIVEKTIACVAKAGDLLVVEWRTTMRDGTRDVVVARFAADGTPQAAWRGPPGGVGRPLRVVPGEALDLDAIQREADRRGHAVGISTSSARTARSSSRGVLETPAGTVPCIQDSIRVSLPFTSGTCTSWHAETPLPLSQLVKFEMVGPLDYYEATVLAAYGWTGAAPTLRLP